MSKNRIGNPMEITFAIIFVAIILWFAGVVIYNWGFDKGRLAESMEVKEQQASKDRQYYASLLSNCRTNSSVPFNLTSSKSLDEVCVCANRQIQSDASTKGQSLTEYHLRLSAEDEEAVYQRCL